MKTKRQFAKGTTLKQAFVGGEFSGRREILKYLVDECALKPEYITMLIEEQYLADSK